VRQISYSPRLDRLVYLDEKATPEFWDARWDAEGRAKRSRQDDEFARLTTRYLPSGSRVLEGGCGRGSKVKALADAGFRAVGVDFAAESVRQARAIYAGLDIREGDVRSLPFAGSEFDGYWSIGVIEHFWKGYDDILAEAGRVLRPGGVLFLTAPWLSPYRRYRVRKGGYAWSDFESEPPAFYQFALTREEVATSLGRHGFAVSRWIGLAPEVCLLEDGQALRPLAQWLFGSRGALPKQVLRRLVAIASAPICGHAFLAIARRRQGT
jgi:SAM-dependent methyltransferase